MLTNWETVSKSIKTLKTLGQNLILVINSLTKEGLILKTKDELTLGGIKDMLLFQMHYLL